MPIDLAHFVQRLTDPFNAESRFYWPLVVAVFITIAANVAWYYWRLPEERTSPFERTVRPWAFWINVIVLIWIAVLLVAKVPSWAYVASFAVNALALAYIYVYWLPPRDAAWERELKRRKYIPEPQRRKRRRR